MLVNPFRRHYRDRMLEKSFSRGHTRSILAIVFAGVATMGWLVYSRNTLGNDFGMYQTIFGVVPRYFARLGVEPLWYPFLEGGFPIGGLIMGQLFHFPAWLLSHFPQFWNGTPVQLFEIKSILLLILAQLATYFFILRFSNCPKLLAVLLSFLCVYQLRWLEATRYGTYLDAAVYGHLLLISIFTYLKSGSGRSAISVALLTYLELTAGYTAMCLYTLLGGAAGFGLFLHRERLSHTQWFRRLTRLGVAFVLGVLIAAPNWAQALDFFSSNAARMGNRNIDWSSEGSLNLHEIFFNIFTPWRAYLSSSFGGSSLFSIFILTLFLICLVDMKKKWPLLFALLLLFIYSFGPPLALFTFFFNFVPGFKVVRIPPRILAALPFVMVFGVIYLINDFYQSPVQRRKILQIVAASAFIVLLVSIVGELSFFLPHAKRLDTLFPDSTPHPENLNVFWNFSTKVYWLLISSVVGLSVLIYCRCELNNQLSQFRHWFLAIVIAGCTLLQSHFLMHYGNFPGKNPYFYPSFTELSTLNYLPTFGSEGVFRATRFPAPQVTAMATLPFTQFIELTGEQRAACYTSYGAKEEDLNSVQIPFYLSDRVQSFENRQALSEALRQDKECHLENEFRVFVNRLPADIKFSNFNSSLISLNRNNKLETLTPNRISLRTQTDRPSVLVTTIPWVEGWTLAVNGAPAKILPVYDAFVGALVPAGENVVTLQFLSPRTIMGFAVFFAALALIGSGFSFFIIRKKNISLSMAWLGCLISVVLAGAGFFNWHRNFEASIRRPILLNNDYPARLARQIQHWQKLPLGN